jgi:hypothetical protein
MIMIWVIGLAGSNKLVLYNDIRCIELRKKLLITIKKIIKKKRMKIYFNLIGSITNKFKNKRKK